MLCVVGINSSNGVKVALWHYRLDVCSTCAGKLSLFTRGGVGWSTKHFIGKETTSNDNPYKVASANARKVFNVAVGLFCQ